MDPDWTLYYTGLPGRYSMMEGIENCCFDLGYKEAHRLVSEMIRVGDVQNFLDFKVFRKEWVK
jgi:hypothetical protein